MLHEHAQGSHERAILRRMPTTGTPLAAPRNMHSRLSVVVTTLITPTPPDLAKSVGQWSDRELYWIIKHGIKLAGMPAFGPTHSDEELWALAAFLRRLPETTPEQYAAKLVPPRPAAAAANIIDEMRADYGSA
jgi:hypothetical protein